MKYVFVPVFSVQIMDLTSYFQLAIKENQNFEEALEIVRKNSKGKIWATGGVVFRNIAHGLYGGSPATSYDFDFAAEEVLPMDQISLPSGWKLTKTGLGEPSFSTEGKQIDLWALEHSVLPTDRGRVAAMNTVEKLESYFRLAPLTVQSIAYDLSKQQIVGDVGIGSILTKSIRINNMDECINFCRRRKISIRNFIRTKANDLGFEPIFPTYSEKNKAATQLFYETYHAEYESTRGDKSFFEHHLGQEAESFLLHLKGNHILDIGAGTGRDAFALTNRGMECVCIDNSPAMIASCKQKGLKAYEMDIEDIDLPDNSFDGVWSYASLVHIPKKRLDNVLARVRELLKPEGILFLGMIEGAGEVLYKSTTKSAGERFFARYSDEELRAKLTEYFFEPIFVNKLSINQKETYLHYVCKKLPFEYQRT